MHRILLLMCAALLLGFAPAPFPKPQRGGDHDKANLARLQGVWDVHQQHHNGTLSNAKGQIRVEGTTLSFGERGGVHSRWAIKVNSRHLPKLITMQRIDGREVDNFAYYALEGGTLQFCYTIGRKDWQTHRTASPPAVTRSTKYLRPPRRRREAPVIAA